MKVKHLKNKDINFIRWDNCINNAINGNVFAYSWYLNILNDDWEALILGNYDYVMPLFKTIKFNKNIYYTSKLGINHGVYSNKLLTEEIVKIFVTAIPQKNSVININLNAHNQLSSEHIKLLSTFELDLIRSYKRISENYSSQFHKELDVANKNNISIVKGLLPNDLINFTKEKNVITKPILNEAEIQKLRMIIAYTLRYNLGESYNAYGAHNNLLATAFFIKSKKKIYLLYAANSKFGLEENAFHILIDKYIEDQSEKDLTLNIENVVSNNNLEFFSGIGAKEYKYQQYYKNNLPLFYRLFIK